MIGIYKIENLINGKKYIGQSTNIHERFLDHKRINERASTKIAQTYPLYRSFKKYGLQNFSFEIIEECPRDQLNEKEKYWIQYYHTYINDINSNGYNLTLGGAGWPNVTDNEIKSFIQLWEQGLSVGQISIITERNNHLIIKYLKQYCSSYNIKEGDRRGRILSGISHRKPINQYDLLGNLVAKYESIQDAAVAINGRASSIIANANFKTKQYKNYYFLYAQENQYEGLVKHINQIGNSKPVIQMDLNHNIIAIYNSTTDAAKALNKNDGRNISACCTGQSQSAYNFYWKYLELSDCNIKKDDK